MTRSITAFGVALALCGLVASGASAATFTASSYPTSFSGAQTTTHVFTVQGQKVECKQVTVVGSLSSPSSEITVTPEYKECTAFGFIGATVDVNECHSKKTVSISFIINVHIGCKEGQSTTVTAGGCVVHIPSQTPTTSVEDASNQGEGILLTSTVSGIHSNVTSGFGCTLSSNSTDTSGKYTGSILLKATAGQTIDIG